MSAQELRERWAGPIAAAWPEPSSLQPPTYEVITPQLLAVRLELASKAPEGDWVQPMVLVTSESSAEGLARAVDGLQLQLAPTLLLVPDGQRGPRSLESEGVVIAPWSTPPSVLAAMLFALSRRQKTVQRIAVDLRISRRVQGGINSEMQRLQEELATAADVQKEFLPHALPKIDGLEFGVVFRPVGYVSGDMYDLFQLDERTVAFFIADVVGHGVPAALLTVALCRGLQTMERAGEVWKPRRPSDVLSKLNDDLVARQLSGQRFATGIYGIIDQVTGEITISCAGHPPPMILTPTGCREIDTSGPLLGVFEDAEFDEVTCRLAAGESLVLYTDGVETAFPSAAGFRRPSLIYREIFSRIGIEAFSRDMTVASTMTDLAEELDRQTGSLHGVDDITVLAISRPAEIAARAAA